MKAYEVGYILRFWETITETLTGKPRKKPYKRYRYVELTDDIIAENLLDALEKAKTIAKAQGWDLVSVKPIRNEITVNYAPLR